MTLQKDKYVYSGKAATLLEISTKTLIKWVEQGHLDCLRQGKNRIFSLREIDNFKKSSFYQKKKPKYTLIYIRAKNNLDIQNLTNLAQNYCQKNSWQEVTIFELSNQEDNLDSYCFQQAFNYLVEGKIERLICCKNQDQTSHIFSTLVRHRGLEVLDVLSL